MGSWDGVLGGDKSKGAKGKGLGGQIEEKQDAIEAKQRDIRQTTASLDATVVNALKGAGDLEFKRLDKRYQQVRDVKGIAEDFTSSIEKALSDIDSAQFWEQQEAMREARPHNEDDHKRGLPGSSFPGMSDDWMSNSSIQDVERSLDNVSSAANRLNDALRCYDGQVRGRVSGPSVRNMGNGLDEIFDMFGHTGGHGGIFGALGNMGSYNVLNNLNQAEREMQSMLSDARSIEGQLSSHLSDASGDRSAYIDKVEALALSAA